MEERVRGQGREQRPGEERVRIGVVTVSTRCSRGESEDTAGPALCGLVQEEFTVGARALVPDDRKRISA